MCLYTTYIPNRRYKPNKKNKGKPGIARAAELLSVPKKCGKCIECRKEKAREWEFRLEQQISKDETAHFVTLTFNEESLNSLKKEHTDDNELCAAAIKRMIKRCERKIGTLKHWFVNEQGHEGTERIHLHGFIWGDGAIEAVKEKWQYGFIFDSGRPKEGAIKYCVKYSYKFDEKHPNFKQKVFASKGIGKDWLKSTEAKRMQNTGKEEPIRLKDGRKMKMPMYFYRKLFNDETREEMFIAKQREEYMFAAGKKIKKTKAGYRYAKEITMTKIEEAIRMGLDSSTEKKDTKKFAIIEKNTTFAQNI